MRVARRVRYYYDYYYYTPRGKHNITITVYHMVSYARGTSIIHKQINIYIARFKLVT